MDLEQLKKNAAVAAMQYVEEDSVIGVGTGSTVNYFIDELAKMKSRIEGCVASSKATEEKLKSHNIPVYDLNAVNKVHVYIDGADEINFYLYAIKGGGGALTREKICAAVAEKFVCIADQSKKVDVLGEKPLPVEVLPMARSYVARQIVKMKGNPVYRENFVTDNGNIIIDIHQLDILQPMHIEKELNNITGIVANGLFAMRPADVLLLAGTEGVKTIHSPL